MFSIDYEIKRYFVFFKKSNKRKYENFNENEMWIF